LALPLMLLSGLSLSIPGPHVPGFLAPSQIGFPLHLECEPLGIRNESWPVRTFFGDQPLIVLNGAPNVPIRVPELTNIKSLGSVDVIEKALDPKHPAFDFF